MLLILMITLVSANIRISQIEKSTSTTITYKNFGPNETDVSGYYVGTNNQYTPIYSYPNNTLVVDGVGPLIPPGEIWTIDYTPWISQDDGSSYYGIKRRFTSNSDVVLRKNFGYIDPANIVDFMEYCDDQYSCIDAGEYWRAATIGRWNSFEIEDRYVTYSGLSILTFNGGAEDYGRQFWTSESLSKNVPCSDINSELLDLINRISALKEFVNC